MNKKFKISVTISDFVVYKAVVSLTPEQYQKMLDTYKNTEWQYFQTQVVSDMTGDDFDENKDYVADMPDVAVAIVLCQNIDYPSCWVGFSLLNSNKDASILEEVDETGQFTWTCEVIE